MKKKNPDISQLLHNTSQILKRVYFTGFSGNRGATFRATLIPVSGNGLRHMNTQLLS